MLVDLDLFTLCPTEVVLSTVLCDLYFLFPEPEPYSNGLCLDVTVFSSVNVSVKGQHYSRLAEYELIFSQTTCSTIIIKALKKWSVGGVKLSAFILYDFHLHATFLFMSTTLSTACMNRICPGNSVRYAMYIYQDVYMTWRY